MQANSIIRCLKRRWGIPHSAGTLIACAVILAGCGGGDAGRPATPSRSTAQTREELEKTPVQPPGQRGPVAAAGWGHIRGRFIVDGTAPTPPSLNVAMANDQFCIDAKPVNKSIVVGEGNGLANAVVFLRLEPNQKLEAHPDYAAALAKPVVLDNKGCEFQSHITLVRTGQVLEVTNSDPVLHNTKVESLSRNAGFNSSLPVGHKELKTFEAAESKPEPVNCSVHPFMKGHILILDHPYMVVSAADGSFEIKNVSAGRHDFAFWHEAAGFIRDLRVASGITNRQGRVSLTISPDQTLELGEIKVPASALQVR
jgi:hypothetical protein